MLKLVLICALAVGMAYAATYSSCSSSSSVSSDCIYGWATQSSSGIPTGGYGGTSYSVTTKAQLWTALKASASKKIIKCSGTIRGDDLGTGSYAGYNYYRTTPTANKFYFDLYLDSFVSSTMSSLKSSNTTAYNLALKASSYLSTFLANEKSQMAIKVPGDTTILGSTTSAQIWGAYFMVNSVDNVIIRNIYFEAARDLATTWSDDDGFNAEFDVFTIQASTRVWVDHCTFTDGRYPDSSAGTFQGEAIQYHDGHVDVKSASDYVTISHCLIENHDKTHLVGSSDSATGDSGHLRVTFWANYFYNTIQRTPRARFGHVHVINNVYSSTASGFEYFIGLGYKSSILSEYNSFTLTSSKKILSYLKGTTFKDVGSWVNGASGSSTINALAKSICGSSYTTTLGWTVPYSYTASTTYSTMRSAVIAAAGSGLVSTKRSDESACNATILRTQECGAYWDGCMLVGSVECNEDQTCNGTHCIGNASYCTSDDDDTPNITVVHASKLSDYGVNGSGWTSNGYSVTTGNNDGSTQTAIYSGSESVKISNATTVSVMFNGTDGNVGLGMNIGGSCVWVNVSLGSNGKANASICSNETGSDECTATSGTVSYSKTSENNLTLYVSCGSSNVSVKAWVNQVTVGNGSVSNSGFNYSTKSVHVTAQGTSAKSFGNMTISSRTSLMVNLTSCVNSSTWASFVAGVLNSDNATVIAQDDTRCASRRAAGEALTSAFETTFVESEAYDTPSQVMAELFTSTVTEQGLASAAGLEIVSTSLVAPSVAFTAAELVADVAVAGAGTAAGLSTAAIIAIAASIGGVAVVGAAATGITVAVKASRKTEAEAEVSPAVAMAVAKPKDGIDVMSHTGAVHSSITNRAAPVAV